MDIDDLEQEVIKLSRKHNIPIKEVRKIWNYQFKRMMQLMKENDIEIKVRGLGKFQFNPYALEKIEQYKQEKHEREILSESSSENGNGAESN